MSRKIAIVTTEFGNNERILSKETLIIDRNNYNEYENKMKKINSVVLAGCSDDPTDNKIGITELADRILKALPEIQDLIIDCMRTIRSLDDPIRLIKETEDYKKHLQQQLSDLKKRRFDMEDRLSHLLSTND